VEVVELGDHGAGEGVVVGEVGVEAAVGPGGADVPEDLVELAFAVDDGWRSAGELKKLSIEGQMPAVCQTSWATGSVRRTLQSW
jgi:hypothetical protein